MNIFKRESKYTKLVKRIESIEEQLGLVFSVDVDGYGSHYEDKHGYGMLTKIDDRLKMLEKDDK